MAVDLFRDTKLRYLGYANEITTGVKHLAPHLVTPKVVKYSHQAVLAYIATDAAEKSMRRLTKDGNPIKMVLQAGDVLIWHGLASVVLPGVVLSKLRASLLQLLNTNPHASRVVPPKMRGLVTAGVGLLAIPIIVTPLDLSVTLLMSCTYRLLFGL